MQRLIPLEGREQWTAALDGIPHAFGHTWESCHAMALTTGLPTYLYVWEHGSGRAVCPLSERTFAGATDVFTPYGFSGFVRTGDTTGLPADWAEYAAGRGYVCGYIGMNPLLGDLDGFCGEDVYEHNELYVLDLTRTQASLFESLSRNRRRQVKTSEQQAGWLIADTRRNAGFMLKHHRASLERKGTAGTYRFSDATLRCILELPNTLLIGAGDGDAVESAWLFTYTRWAAESFMSVALPGAEHHAAALTWHGMLELRRRGIPILNLGGGVHRDDGIARFKQRFGPSAVSLCALKQVYRPGEYERLCRAAGMDPDDRSGFFPPYWRSPGRQVMDGEPSSPYA